jgi:hypothetical protein
MHVVIVNETARIVRRTGKGVEKDVVGENDLIQKKV